jgi:hypothetical protein
MRKKCSATREKAVFVFAKNRKEELLKMFQKNKYPNNTEVLLLWLY